MAEKLLPPDPRRVALQESVQRGLKSVAGLTVPLEALKEIQQDYLQQATQLWNLALSHPDQLTAPKDRRFAAQEWSATPVSAFISSMYALNASTMSRLAQNLTGEDKARDRVRFAVQQWVDAVSPANFLALNPEAQRKAVETRGASIKDGLQHLLHDVGQGHVSQTDESLFEVGRNVATTEGAVVFENEFFQLIEYKPLTKQVYKTPFLFVPPCINKFYILDLQPENSLIRYTVEQGHRVFVISWVNADESLAKATWDDYIGDGVIKALEVTRSIAGTEQANTLGFCVGGTLLATALAVLAARGEKPAASATFLTTFLDFVNTGTLDLFVDETMVQLREATIGERSPAGGGLMKGSDLAATFSFLRANDLVWNYVVGNYLKGETPPAFDLLYWNSDSTNLPGPMYCWYLRHTYLENKLARPNATTVCGVPVDLRRLDLPAFVYASREDHIVPWDSAYATTRLLQGDTTFVLGASGHIAGVINPPQKGKRSYWTLPAAATPPKKGRASARRSVLPDQPGEWQDQAQEHPGSWWPAWSAWLAAQTESQGKVAAPKAPGNKVHQAIEPAPGRYVLRKV